MGVQALEARGEPLLSSFETTTEGVSRYFKPHGWQLLELLGPQCATYSLNILLWGCTIVMCMPHTQVLTTSNL